MQLHFKIDGLAWVAFVDANFDLLPQPAWDPTTCWRTHMALVCTEHSMVAHRKPRCYEDIVRHAVRLGTKLKMFVRLDWYADRHKGPLMGEITLFPHMLQPRNFYSSWTCRTVRALWRDPDGCALDGSMPELEPKAPLIPGIGAASTPTVASSRTMALEREAKGIPGLSTRIERQLQRAGASLLDFVADSDEPWAVALASTGKTSTGGATSFRTLRRQIATFELAPWGVAADDRVALLVANGADLAAALLCVMSRYCAVPLDASTPEEAIEAELASRSVRVLVVVESSAEASKAHRAQERIADDAAAHVDLTMVELQQVRSLDLRGAPGRLALPPPQPTIGTPHAAEQTPLRGSDDLVLLLRTSGTTGAPKGVGFTLRRLMLAGAGISTSIGLTADDIGLSMLPLHHVGGISYVCGPRTPPPQRFAAYLT